VIIYIPIKENSQRVPRKNFREFKGKPLWEHTVDKLKDFQVVIDTDSQEIIDGCKDKKWVTTYVRPQNLQGDKVSVVDLIGNYFQDFPKETWILQLHVTSPFITEKTINQLKELTKTSHDSFFSVDKIQNRFWRDETYGLVPINHNPMKLEQTQDLPPYYMENSCFYLFKRSVLDYGTRIGKKPLQIEIEFPENLDIDTEKDWEIVKLLENYEW